MSGIDYTQIATTMLTPFDIHINFTQNNVYLTTRLNYTRAEEYSVSVYYKSMKVDNVFSITKDIISWYYNR